MKKILFLGLLMSLFFQGCVSVSFQCCVYSAGGAGINQTNRGG